MGISGMIFLAVMVIAFFTYIYVIVKSARGWGGLHTTMLILIFLSSLGFLFTSAVVVDRRVIENKVYDSVKKKHDQLEAEAHKVQYGEFDRQTPEESALIPLLNKFNRATFDRGRVWRGLQKTAVAKNGSDVRTIDLKIVNRSAETESPSGSPVSAPAANLPIESIQGESIVYLFSEGTVGENKFMPKVFLGEFFVELSQNENVKVRPTASMSPRQIEGLDDSDRFALYELLPVDSHDAFANLDSSPSDEAIFGTMDGGAIGQLLGIPEELRTMEPEKIADPVQRQKASLWRSYVVDGQPAPDGTAPESIWIRVEFLQEHKVSVDSQENRNAVDGGHFDTSGRATDSRLKRNDDESEVVFRPGETRVLLKEPAEQLIRDGIAKLIQPIFVRPLNDYKFAFHNFRLQLARVGEQIELTTRENKVVEQTNQLGRELIGKRQIEGVNLDKELAQHEKELSVIQSELARLTIETASIRKSLVDLMESNRTLHQQLVETQLGLANAINSIEP